jgi:hypothetical protein
MSAIDKVKAHFSGKKTRDMEVPEWGFKVYVKPINLTTRNQWNALSGGDNAHYLAISVAKGAVDKDGTRLFSDQDIESLMEASDGTVVGQVASFILGLDETEEGIGKN